FAGPAGRGQRQTTGIAGYEMTCRIQSFDLDLEALDRGIDKARRAADHAFFSEDMPGLERLPQFERYPAVLDRTEIGKAEFALGLEPYRIERVAGAPQIAKHVQKVLPDEMPEHEAVVQRRSPADQRAAQRLAPEPGDQRPQQKLLGKT